MKQIELHSAFFFDCDECGREVLIRGEMVHKKIVLENTPEKYREAAQEYFSMYGDYVVVPPETVTCTHKDCLATFEVFEPPLDKDLEDDMC